MTVHEFPHGRSIPQLLSDVVNQLTTLVSKEVRLARVEMSEGISRAGTGVTLVGIGAVLLIPGLVVLLEAGVQALIENGMTQSLAALIVGGAVVVIGLILLMVGASRLKPQALMPNKTMEQMRRDASVAAQQVRYGDDHANRAA